MRNRDMVRQAVELPLNALVSDSDWQFSGSEAGFSSDHSFLPGRSIKIGVKGDTAHSASVNIPPGALLGHSGISLRCYIPEDSFAGIGHIRVRLEKDSENYFLRNMQKPLKADQWDVLHGRLDGFAMIGSLTLEEVTRIRIGPFPDVAGTFAAYVDNIVLYTTSGGVLFDFDDGYASQYEYVYPLFRKYGVRGTVFVVTDWVEKDDFVSWDQLREMHEYGFDIGSHSHTHPIFDTIDEQELRAELETSQMLLLKNGLYRGNRFLAQPGGVTTAAINSVISDYYRMARPSGGANNFKIDPYEIRRRPFVSLGYRSIDNRPTNDLVIEWINDAHTNGYIVPLLAHRVDTQPDGANRTNVFRLQRTLEYIVQRGIPVYTYSDLFE